MLFIYAKKKLNLFFYGNLFSFYLLLKAVSVTDMEAYTAAKTYKAEKALRKRADEIDELQEELDNALALYREAFETHTKAENNLEYAASQLKKWKEEVAEATKLLEMAALELAVCDKVVTETSACFNHALAKANQQ
jgi:hypothetical protein